MSKRIFYDGIGFRLKGWRKVKSIAEKVITDEKYISGDLNFIVTSDDAILAINKQFLGHDFFTDVITFNYNDNYTVNGEIYISLSTVRKNAVNYNVSLNIEMVRVIIHGILHLCGYNDESLKEQVVMKKKEEYYLKIFKENL